MKKLTGLGGKIKKVLVGYLKTQFILMVFIGVATWGILALLHVKYAILLGILTGVLSSIPNFGIMIATIAATLVAIFDKVVFLPNSSPVIEGTIVLVIFILLNKLVDLFLTPIFLGKTNKVNPWILFLLVFLGTVFFGVWGAVLLVPLFLIIKTIVEHFIDQL